MTVIGLCGASGSGKGTVCKFFGERGIECIDADLVYREITANASPCLDEIAKAFGDKVICNGMLDRRTLAKTVFGDKEKLKLLNQITHKYILSEIRKRISVAEQRGDDFIVVDAPLLFESGFDSECDVIVAVCAPVDVRINRITERDCISREEALARLSSQKDNDFYRKNADFVIENDSDVLSLADNTDAVIDKICYGDRV
ncbi:MAG: dephospho-CoA kinase [Eubacteriales bacterium]|nr:dephospho-CoA kinase [Eubacteriales bacterium]